MSTTIDIDDNIPDTDDDDVIDDGEGTPTASEPTGTLSDGRAPNGVAFTIHHPSQPGNWTTMAIYRDDTTGLVKLRRRERRATAGEATEMNYPWTTTRATQVATAIAARIGAGAKTMTGPHPVWCGPDGAVGPVASVRTGASALDANVLRKSKTSNIRDLVGNLGYYLSSEDAAVVGAAVAHLAPLAATPTAASRSKEERAAAVVVYTRPSGERYYPRIVDGDISDVEMLRKARAAKMPVMFVGVPGTGKSACVEAAFNDVIALDGTGDTEVADFVGGYAPDPDVPGRYIWGDGPLIEAMNQGRPFFVDEISRINSQVLTIVFPLMDGRDRITAHGRPLNIGGPTVIAQPGFCVVGAYNPDIPGCRIDEPLASRFAIHVEFTTDYALASRLKVPAAAMKVARKLDKMRRDPSHPLAWAPQLRELIRFRDQAATFSEVFAWRALLAASPNEDRPVVAQVVEEFVGAKGMDRLSTNGAA